jgi:hypothetical protein
MTTAAAEAAQLHAEILHIEPKSRSVRYRECVESSVRDVDNGIAAKTYEMVVHLRASVIADHTSRVTGFGDDSQAHQALERAIDGRARDLGSTHR